MLIFLGWGQGKQNKVLNVSEDLPGLSSRAGGSGIPSGSKIHLSSAVVLAPLPATMGVASGLSPAPKANLPLSTAPPSQDARVIRFQVSLPGPVTVCSDATLAPSFTVEPQESLQEQVSRLPGAELTVQPLCICQGVTISHHFADGELKEY